MYCNACLICTDISYAKVTTGVTSSSLVPPSGTQRNKARSTGEMLTCSQPLRIQFVFYMTMLPITFCLADANILTEASLWHLVGRKMYSRWKEFAVHLHVETRITDVVYKQCLAIVEECFKEVTHRWLHNRDGTGDLPRTWETVYEALKLTGFPLLVGDVREALSKECSRGEERLLTVHVVPLTLVSDVHFQLSVACPTEQIFHA